MNVAVSQEPRLGIVRKLVDVFEQQAVDYCHFKSNEHLLAAVQGDTDLDVVFRPEQKARVEQALAAAGFKRFQAVGSKKYPDIEDYLGIDPDTGKIVHVHGHYALHAGESGVKDYTLPWQEALLETAVKDEQCHFQRAAYPLELLLLIVRSALKLTLWNRLKSRFRRLTLKGDAQREFLWLKERVSRAELLAAADSLSSTPMDFAPVFHVYDAGLDVDKLRRVLTGNRRVLRQWRRLGVWAALRVRINYFRVRVVRKLRIPVFPVFRVAERQGLVVAFMGCDGSGKSTQTERVCRMLAKKLDVAFIYMGSGKGRSGWLRQPLVWAKALKARFTPPVAGQQSMTDMAGLSFPKHPLKRAFRIVWAVSLLWERQSKMRQADRVRRLGGMVICDRYPQAEQSGFNDGPLLQALAHSPWALLRWLSQWELGVFRSFAGTPPDLVIKFEAAPELLRSRRPEMTIDEIRIKQDAILALTFPAATEVRVIDANRGLDEVFAAVMTAIAQQIERKC